ncbi:MAG: hypothetical protein ABFC78_09830 [Methanoregula sp.]|jgi:hypothetical protein
MTEKLTIKDLNCGNCGNHRLIGRIPDIDECAIMDHTPTREEIKFIKKWGCIHNPLALQVLATPVMEELGKEEKDQIEIYQNATTKNEEVYHQGIVFGIQRAAKLLKEGVKKP